MDDVPVELFQRHLGLPEGESLDDASEELAEDCRLWYARHGDPWRLRSPVIALEPSADPSRTVLLRSGSRWSSPILAEGFRRAGVTSVVVVGVSAGRAIDREVEKRWNDGQAAEALFLSAYGVAVAEHLRAREYASLSNSLAALPPYSPGYPGWSLADQASVLEALQERGPLQVLPSGALRPTKSTLSVFGVPADPTAGRDRYWEGVSVRREAPSSPQNAIAEYAVPETALKKWSTQRLSVTRDSQENLNARFRFRGTTCSSLSMPLAFDYHVRLVREASGFRIDAASCRPVEGDRGHRSMCSYLEAPERFESLCQAPAGIVGRRLASVLEWNPDVAPSACLCSPAHRHHKWRLVLQTIHYFVDRASSSYELISDARSGLSNETRSVKT